MDRPQKVARKAVGDRGYAVHPSQAPEPPPMEVESARTLANESSETLGADGLGEDLIRRYADAYVALDVGDGSAEDFIAWVRASRR